MRTITLMELKDRTERMVINDLAFQDPLLMFCEVNISVNLFEKKTDDWVALVDVEAPGVDNCFFEISYLVSGDEAVVGTYRMLAHNPYKLGRLYS